jgi:hypothetical protein
VVGDVLALLQKLCGHLTHNDLHHDQVLEVAVRLEQGLSSEELDEDTADREHVAREGPSET